MGKVELRSVTMKTILASLLLFVAAPAFAQINIAGDWDMQIETAQGVNTVKVTFKQDGEKVSGVMKSQAGERAFEGGTLTGADLKFGFSIPIQGQALEITMTGKVQGSSIVGRAQFGGFGEGDWTAKRAETTTTAAAPATTTTTETTTASSATTTAAATTTATGVGGKWNVLVKTDAGEIEATADIVETGGKITGTITGPLGSVDVSGTLEGSALKLSMVAKTPQGDIPVSLSGDVSGDTIVNGKAEFGGMESTWSAKRKP
jgi:hypothetical protein